MSITISHGEGDINDTPNHKEKFNKVSSSRSESFNYLDIIPDGHWISIKIGSSLEEVTKEEARALLESTDRIVILFEKDKIGDLQSYVGHYPSNTEDFDTFEEEYSITKYLTLDEND